MKAAAPGDHLMAKQILLNAFNMNCIGHINHGLWTHPRDTSTQYKTLDYWTNLARLLERGLFDGLFIADIVGTYDVYGSRWTSRSRSRSSCRSTTRCCWSRPWPR
jgi:alkanesulfonate monooxygenase SsuD/methylene tetrahydromethanopterin reductase-like flavin-dependent oxidoreductase (luciferase family)